MIIALTLIFCFAAAAFGDVFIFEIRKQREEQEERKIISGDWVELKRELVFLIPDGSFVIFQVMGPSGYQRRYGVLPEKEKPAAEEPIATARRGEPEAEAAKLAAVAPEGPLPPSEAGTPSASGKFPAEYSSQSMVSVEDLKEAFNRKYPEAIKLKAAKYVVQPVEEMICPVTGKTLGFGKKGESIRFLFYEKVKDGDAEYRGKCEVKIIRQGLNLVTPDSLNPTPLFIVEIGKKKNAKGEKTTSFAPGAGVSYLFFYKHTDHQKLSNLGFGLNFSYSKTQMVDEAVGSVKTTGVGTFGGVGAYKPVENLPLFFQIVGGLNFTGDDRYGFAAFGIASPIDLKRLAAE